MVVDRTRPMDFEVYAVERVVGYGEGVGRASRSSGRSTRRSTPTARCRARGYFTMRREPRALSEAAASRRRADRLHRQRGVPLAGRSRARRRTPADPPARGGGARRQPRPAAADAGRAATADFSLAALRARRGRPVPARPEPPPLRRSPTGEIAWRLINHLSLNYLTVTDLDAGAGRDRAPRVPGALRGPRRRRHAPTPSRGARRRACAASRSRRARAGCPCPAPSCSGAGLEIRVTVDEAAVRRGQRLPARRGARAGVRRGSRR